MAHDTYIFSDTGIVHRHWTETPDAERDYGYVTEPFEGSIMEILSHGIEVDGLTFRGFIKRLHNDEYRAAIILTFISHAGGFAEWLDAFNRIVDEPCEPDTDPDALTIDHLEVHHLTMEHYSSDEFPEVYGWGFGGWGDWPKSDNDSGTNTGPVKGGIAIEFTPVNEIADLEIRINRTFGAAVYGNRNHPLNDMKFTAPITVYDFIGAIVYEMTFAGIVEPGARTILDDLQDDLDKIISGAVPVPQITPPTEEE